jgi:poly-gamma-glutamate synthesis protein (capsule biosynthesis protein)
MKKRKMKLWVKVLLVIIIVAMLFFAIPRKSKEQKEEKAPEEKEDIVEVIFEKLNTYNIDKDFIIWINNNYEDALPLLKDLLSKNEYQENYWHEVTGNSYLVLNDLYTNKYESMDNVKIMESKSPSTISFVGDISLADNWYIMPEYDKRNKGVLGILSEDVVKIMTESDLMIANSEFTVSNRGEAMSGKQYTFRAKKERLPIYFDMGIDLVTLANNHVYDFGKTAFLDMLDAFDEYKIPHIGAGHNIEEAKEEYYFIVNGYKVAFLNGTRAEKYIMTPAATEDNPGVFRCYDPKEMIEQIKKVKENSDYVIVIMHFGKEGSHDLEKEQVESAKLYIDAGADVIVGHHAHVLQGIEFYNDKPIIYNLGDFIFNGNKEETAIFQILLNNDGTMKYNIIPALQENKFTDILKGEAKKKLIDKINSWSVNALIDEEGNISKK